MISLFLIQNAIQIRAVDVWSSDLLFLGYFSHLNLINFSQIFQQTHFHEMKCKITVTAGADMLKNKKQKKKNTFLYDKKIFF